MRERPQRRAPDEIMIVPGNILGRNRIVRALKTFLKNKGKLRVTLLPGTRLIIEDVSNLEL